VIAELEEFGSALRGKAGEVYILDRRIMFLWWLERAFAVLAPHLWPGNHRQSHVVDRAERESLSPLMCLQPASDSEQSVGGYSLSYPHTLLISLRSRGG
jgi:hypothetical protein